jgi:hypothetical protein
MLKQGIEFTYDVLNQFAWISRAAEICVIETSMAIDSKLP